MRALLPLVFGLLSPLFWRGRVGLRQNKWLFVRKLHLSVIAGNQRNAEIFCQILISSALFFFR